MLALMPHKLCAHQLTHATILGLLLGFAAIIGDLAESIIKRSCDVKDSGRMLPGIGGALDLIDSLLFTAPLLFFYMRIVITFHEKRRVVVLGRHRLDRRRARKKSRTIFPTGWKS